MSVCSLFNNVEREREREREENSFSLSLSTTKNIICSLLAGRSSCPNWHLFFNQGLNIKYFNICDLS